MTDSLLLSLSSKDPSSNSKILAVDDNESNLIMLRRYLVHEGYQVFTTTNPFDALNLIKEQKFDLILCDLIMPEISGFDLLKQLKDDPQAMSIPVIVLSASDDIETIAASIESGAEDYLLKPLNKILLRARIRATLEKKFLSDREKAYIELLNRELFAAKRLQESILPTEFIAEKGVAIASYIQPALEIGGDFYDYFWLSSNHLAIIIADVSGKGITGALFMAVCRTLIKSLAPFFQDPKTCVEMVNKILCENNQSSMFVTLFYSVLDISTGQLEYINAGHCPLFQLTSGQQTIIHRDISGPPLGIDGTRTYISYKITLASNDFLILYTDGVTEATNAVFELFGYPRLQHVLNQNSATTPKDLLENLNTTLKAFVGTADQADDITWTVVQYRKD